MNAVVEGTQVPVSQLASLTDWIAVKRVGELISSPIYSQSMRWQYNKLNLDPVIREAQNDPTREHHLIDNIVTSLVAMKSISA
jgi:EKC/KEOPS complex subunit CGI121/TPRKB